MKKTILLLTTAFAIACFSYCMVGCSGSPEDTTVDKEKQDKVVKEEDEEKPNPVKSYGIAD